MSKHLKNIGVVSVFTIISRVLGLARDSMVSAVFGAGTLSSAFVMAFRVPNLFRRLLAEGAFTAAFVPTLLEEMHQRKEAGAFRLINQAASWLLVITSGIVAVAMVALRIGIIEIDGGQWMAKEPEVALRWLTAVRLGLILFSYLIFVCIAAALCAALQSLQRFVEPALNPIWLNLAMIGALAGGYYGHLAGGDLWRAMLWLSYGTLVGGFLQMAVPAIALMRCGWRPAFELKADPQVRQIGRLMVPTVLGSAVYLINMLVSQSFTLSVSDSAGTILYNAGRLMELPIGVFAIAVSTVVFPLISKHAAAGKWDLLASAYRKGMSLILVINVPAAVGLSVLAAPTIRVLFEHGRFSSEDTMAMAPILIIYAFGLPFLAAVSMLLRAFYAHKDTVRPVQAAVLSFGVNLGLTLLLRHRFGTAGLAIASTAAVIVQAVYLQVRLVEKQPELAFRHLLRDFWRVLVASLIMGVGVFEGSAYAPHGNFALEAVMLGLLIAVGVTLYGTFAWLLGIQGRDDLLQLVARFRKRA